jgi:hypothetical protein
MIERNNMEEFVNDYSTELITVLNTMDFMSIRASFRMKILTEETNVKYKKTKAKAKEKDNAN